MPIDPLNVPSIRMDSTAPEEAGQTVRQVQTALNSLHGRPALAEDGVFGPETREAVRGFQRSRQMPETGEIDQPLVEALNRAVTQKAAAADCLDLSGETGSPLAQADLSLAGDVARTRLAEALGRAEMRAPGAGVEPRTLQQMARLVVENPGLASGLLGDAARLTEAFGPRTPVDRLDASLRTMLELHSRGNLEGLGSLGEGISKDNLKSILFEKAGVEHAEHEENHVEFGECAHVEHVDIDGRPGEKIQPANPATQKLIAHVMDNVDQLAAFQADPAALARQFGFQGDLGRVQTVLDIIGRVASGQLGAASEHLEDVLGGIEAPGQKG